MRKVASLTVTGWLVVALLAFLALPMGAGDEEDALVLLLTSANWGYLATCG